MKTPHDIILKPIITEQSMEETMRGKYTFVVAKNATKTEIKKACEDMFEVKVLKVNTMHFAGKMRRMGKNKGRTASWKKAVITIDQMCIRDRFPACRDARGEPPRRDRAFYLYLDRT